MTQWTVGERNGTAKLADIEKMEHLEPFEIDNKTKKDQIPYIQGWNKMRQKLIDNGLMESK